MNVEEPEFLMVGHGLCSRNIAYHYLDENNQKDDSPSNNVGVMFLPGFQSIMNSTKGNAIAFWARENQKACMLFDFSGHGQSEGLFTDGTISRWLEEATAIFEKTSPHPMVLVGSSMGGYLALLLVRRLLFVNQRTGGLHEEDEDAANQHLQRIRALVLLAPAWDMSEELFWKSFSPDAQQQILQNGVYMQPSRYEDGPYPITRDLILDGRKHLLGARDKVDENPKQHHSPFHPQVEILHGCRDLDVPITHSERLVSMLRSIGATVRLTKIVDGDHRLSSSQHLKVLFKILDQVAH